MGRSVNRAVGFFTYGTLILAALALGGLVFRGLRRRGLCERLAAASLPLSALVIVSSWLTTIGIDPVVEPWSAARLAPAVGLRHGHPLYYPSSNGPVTGWIYPPLAPVVYLPATLIPGPTGAVLAGRLLSLVYYFTPAAWLLLTARADRTRGTWIGAVLLVSTFALLSHQCRPLRYVSSEIHADAPALALAIVAVGLMARSRPDDRPWRQATAIILATLSVWTKQLTAPIVLFVLPCWAFVTGGSRGFFKFVAMALIGGLSISLLLLALFGPSNMIFNILTVPLLHPRRVESLTWSNLLALALPNMFLLVLLASGGLAQLRARSRGCATPIWPLFLLAAFAVAPLSVMAYSKIGGDDNNLGFVIEFLTLAGLLMHARFMALSRDPAEGNKATSAFRGILALNLVLTLLGAHEVALALAKPGPTWQEQQRAALHYIERHRGEVYFPWNPLEHLIAEGQQYHFEYGVFDRVLAGHPLSDEHFRSHIPPNTRLVCYPPRTTVGSRMTLMYLREFREQIRVDELPGWACYRRPEPASPREGGMPEGMGL